MQYDVHRLRRRGRIVVNCQSGLLASLKTRFVLPLLSPQAFDPGSSKLNPGFMIEGERRFLVPQAAATVLVEELGSVIASLRDERDTIVRAIDLLLSGV